MTNQLFRFATLGLAALTTLGGALVLFFLLIQPVEGPAWFAGAKVLAALFVVAMGVLTARYLLASWTPMPLRHVLLAGAIGLTALGAAGAVWGLHLAQVTGDLEAWAILMCLMISAQGAATIWHLWTSGEPLAPLVS